METDVEDRRLLTTIGIALACVGATTAGIGMNLIKASGRYESHRPLYKRWRFLLGVSTVFVINGGLDSLAFALAPLAVIAPIGGLTIVTSALVANSGITGSVERLNGLQWLIIFVITGGVAAVVCFGPKPAAELNNEEALQNFTETPFVVYQLSTVGVVLCTYSLLILKLAPPCTYRRTICTGVAAGMCSGITQSMLKIIAVTGVEFVTTGVLDWKNVMLWMAVVELAIAAMVLLHMLNLCLASAPVSIATSMYQTAMILMTVCAGIALYHDLTPDTNPSEIGTFVTAVVFVITGVGVLMKTRQPPHETLLGVTTRSDAERHDVLELGSQNTDG